MGGLPAKRAALLDLACAVLGLAPLLSAISLIRTAWAPFADTALITANVVDTFTRHPPLVGMPTSLGFEGGEPLSHLGPVGFWVLAPTTKLLGEPGDGVVIGALLLTCAVVAAVAAVARRFDDRRMEPLVLALTAGMMASLGGTIFTDPWNPYVGILPLLVTALAAVGVLAGNHRLLWVFVLAGSFTAEVHLGYVPVVGALLVCVVVSMVLDVRRSRGATRQRLLRRTVPIALAVGVVAWIGPIIDLLAGSQNLTRVVANQSSSSARVAGFDHARAVAVDMTSIPPRWILERARDRRAPDPNALRIALSLAAVAGVVALTVWAWRHGHRLLRSLGIVSLVSVAASTVATARSLLITADYVFDSRQLLVYRLFWWPVSALFFLTLLYGAVTVLTKRTADATAEARTNGWLLPAAAVVLAAVLVPVGYRSPLKGLDGVHEGDVTLAAAIAELPGDSVVLRYWPEGERPDPQAPEFGYAAGLIAQLRLRGIGVRFVDEGGEDGSFMLAYRDAHRADDDAEPVVLYRAGPAARRDPPPGWRRLASAGPPPGTLNPYFLPSVVYVRE